MVTHNHSFSHTESYHLVRHNVFTSDPISYYGRVSAGLGTTFSS